MHHVIHSRILTIRSLRILLDADLAQLYGIETRALVQAVRRNVARFPEDFMFELTAQEFTDLKSQSVISSGGHGGRRTAPFAFTEQGVAMLSSVLNSPRALAVNIEIMRTFVNIRRLTETNADLGRRLADLEKQSLFVADQHATFRDDTQLQLKKIFEAIRQLMFQPEPVKRSIGFVPPEDRAAK